MILSATMQLVMLAIPCISVRLAGQTLTPLRPSARVASTRRIPSIESSIASFALSQGVLKSCQITEKYKAADYIT